VCVENGGGQAVAGIMASAGYDLDEVRTQPGFVCAINGKPDPASSCARTPPADAYWGLFWSNGSSGSWSYSSTGAHSLEVPDGGSVGWRWQNSNTRTAPGAPPTTGTPKPEPSKPTKPPKPTKPGPEPTKDPTTPAPPSGTPSDTPAGTPSQSPTAADTKAERAERAAQAERAEKRAERRRAEAQRRVDRRAQDDEAQQSATPSGTPTEDAQVTADGPAEEETPLTPASATDDGNGALTWVAGGAVLLLAVAAGVLARRRRG
jgi:hypothetical protein